MFSYLSLMFFETVKIVCFEFVQPQYTTWHIGHLLVFELNGYLCEYWSSTHMWVQSCKGSYWSLWFCTCKAGMQGCWMKYCISYQTNRSSLLLIYRGNVLLCALVPRKLSVIFKFDQNLRKAKHWLLCLRFMIWVQKGGG